MWRGVPLRWRSRRVRMSVGRRLGGMRRRVRRVRRLSVRRRVSVCRRVSVRWRMGLGAMTVRCMRGRIIVCRRRRGGETHVLLPPRRSLMRWLLSVPTRAYGRAERVQAIGRANAQVAWPRWSEAAAWLRRRLSPLRCRLLTGRTRRLGGRLSPRGRWLPPRLRLLAPTLLRRGLRCRRLLTPTLLRRMLLRRMLSPRRLLRRLRRGLPPRLRLRSGVASGRMLSRWGRLRCGRG
jgi:hypothetical protein